jgi:hypothetical protein
MGDLRGYIKFGRISKKDVSTKIVLSFNIMAGAALQSAMSGAMILQRLLAT